MPSKPTRSRRGQRLSLQVNESDMARLEEEAFARGYDLFTLIRVRLFARMRGVSIRVRASADILAMAALSGCLQQFNAQLKEIGDVLRQLLRGPTTSEASPSSIRQSLTLIERVADQSLNALDRLAAAITSGSTHPAKKED